MLVLNYLNFTPSGCRRITRASVPSLPCSFLSDTYTQRQKNSPVPYYANSASQYNHTRPIEPRSLKELKELSFYWSTRPFCSECYYHTLSYCASLQVPFSRRRRLPSNACPEERLVPFSPPNLRCGKLATFIRRSSIAPESEGLKKFSWHTQLHPRRDAVVSSLLGTTLNSREGQVSTY